MVPSLWPQVAEHQAASKTQSVCKANKLAPAERLVCGFSLIFIDTFQLDSFCWWGPETTCWTVRLEEDIQQLDGSSICKRLTVATDT